MPCNLRQHCWSRRQPVQTFQMYCRKHAFDFYLVTYSLSQFLLAAAKISVRFVKDKEDIIQAETVTRSRNKRA